MRELKDYFCNAEQSKELIELGLNCSVLAVHLGSNLRQIPLAYNLNPHETKAALRSQALDFFIDLGYEIIQETTKSYICWHVIIKGEVKTYVDGDLLFHVSESLLISKLIELEKEARNV